MMPFWVSTSRCLILNVYLFILNVTGEGKLLVTIFKYSTLNCKYVSSLISTVVKQIKMKNFWSAGLNTKKYTGDNSREKKLVSCSEFGDMFKLYILF